MKKLYMIITLMFVITISKAQAPVNDNCSGAISLSISATCTPTTGTLANATGSSVAACTGTPSNDVWYSFVATAPNLNITVSIGGSWNLDPAIQVFSSSCGGTSISCTDNYGVGVSEAVCLSGLTAGNSYWVRVYDATGSTSTPQFAICLTPCNNSAIAEIQAESTITISPNPFTSTTTISFSEEQNHTTVIITDVLGKAVKTISFTGKQCVIEKEALSNGIYFVRIEDLNKNIVNRKIVVQ